MRGCGYYMKSAIDGMSSFDLHAQSIAERVKDRGRGDDAYSDWLWDNDLIDNEANFDRWVEMETERILGAED